VLLTLFLPSPYAPAENWLDDCVIAPTLKLAYREKSVRLCAEETSRVTVAIPSTREVSYCHHRIGRNPLREIREESHELDGGSLGVRQSQQF
jgi:hypothetical protein